MPFDKDNQIDENQQGLDIEAASASIGEDLFGQDEDSAPAGGEGESGVDSQTSSPQLPTEDKATEAKETDGEAKPEGEGGADASAAAEAPTEAPKTWSKEAVASWADLPAHVQAEITKREGDFLNGIQMYKAGAELGQRYDTVVEPYRAILAAENIDPVQLFQSFAGNHYLLSRGTPEQKLQVAASLIKAYNIPLDALNGHFGDQVDEPEDPTITALKKEIAELRSGFTSQQKRETEASQTVILQEIEAFAKDPAHPYFDELAQDIGKLLEGGLAKDLSDAYEKAVYANPVTRQKEIDRLRADALSAAAAEAQKRNDKITRSTGDHVETNQNSRDGTIPLGSMDDTLAATMAKIEARG